jgi:hypothetical protein
MAQSRQAATAAARSSQRILRVGIIQGGRIIEERLIRSHKTISIGQSPRNSFVLSSPNLPRRYEVFAPRGEAYEMRFAPGMDGRVTVGGGVRTLTQIREQKIAKQFGDWWHLPMETSSRGKLVVGDVTVLFQFVPAPPDVPHARLPATIRGGVTSRMDNMYTSILGACFVLGLAFGVAAELTPKPKPTASKRIRQLVEAKTKTGEDMKPKPKPMEADKPDMDAGMDAVAEGMDVAAPAPDSKGKAEKANAEIKKELSKGGEGYKKLLADVTAIAMATGGGTMNGIVIAGQCSGAECEKATAAVDGLKGPLSTTDLDDRANNSSGVGGANQTGPGTGRPGHGGPVRGKPGSGPLTGKGVGTGETGTPGGEKPKSVVAIKAKFTSVVPVPRGLEGGAGDKVRKKVASLVYGLRFCYNRALQSNPKLQGAVKVSVVIMPNGKMSNVNAESGMGGGVAECIKGRVGSWSVGNVGKQAFYTFTLQFAPGGG